MSTSTIVGNSEGPVTGLCSAPPPPPPPPPSTGQVPAMRINTVEAPTIRRPQLVNDGYEPPAAIQNAMLTKDKKPFTYTPGMGGKLDLSQIRSPRMARRVAKNANDEGIEGPPKSALEQKPVPTTNAPPSLFIQPQVAIPVFPTNIPVPPPANRTPPTPPANRTPPTPSANRTQTTPTLNRTPSNVPERQPEVIKPVAKVETKVAPLATTSVQPGSPESPSTPTQVTLAKAPTPWMQNKNKPQEELPEWAKRSNANKQSSSPDSPTSPPVYTVQQSQPTPPPAQTQWQPAQQRPLSQQPQSYQNQQPQSFAQQQQKRPYSSPPVSQQANSQPQERVIPIRIEDRPSVFDVKREPGHHQFKQPSPHHQQRWGQQSGPNQMQNQVQNQMQNQVQNQVQKQPMAVLQPAPSTGGAYIIPIMVEGSEKKPVGGPVPNSSFSQPAMVVRNNVQGGDSQTVKVIPQRGPVSVQSDSGPVQSRSFRVLQKITDTDSTNDVDPEQLRKLQLQEDDRVLMNKFKEQVDNENTLHYEEDPRYRGSAIPSRAFRYLQTMTDAGDVPVTSTPRQQAAINKRQNRNSKSFEESQANLPPSEQQVPEPKKYMGSAIPSKSFRILQAMTAPESVATQENRQADYTCQTENNVPGNQQPVVLPPLWVPEGGWWGYYPLPYPNDSYPYHPDNTAYVYFPIYNQNYSSYPGASDDKPYPYPPSYVVPVPPQASNCDHGFQQASFEPANAEPASKTQESNDVTKDTNWENSVSRTASSDSKDSDCTTAMNITDEEEIPETILAVEDDLPDRSQDDKRGTASSNASSNPSLNPSLNVPVPNYTYIDTSDSSESTDSESPMDNESVIESSKSISDRNSGDTSSESEDSDSYLAYSTGLNPHGRVEKDQKAGAESVTEKSVEDEGRAEEADATVPHQLSVIYEDEQTDFEGPRSQEARKQRNPSGTAFEATDDPPDEVDNTTVSVSLPLRFKFSVSENNEDVTTVIVGDSTIKRACDKDDARASRPQEQKTSVEVSANFRVDNDTSADFTVRRETSDGKRRGQQAPKSVTVDRIKEDSSEEHEDPVVPHVNFTLRKIPTRLGRINCEETVETEFTIKRRSSRKEEDCSLSTSTVTSNEDSSTISRETVIEDRSDVRDFNKNVQKPEVIVSECNGKDYSEQDRIESGVESSRKMEEERKEPKHLLSVQNSREETDDEDSGVTSDMSRMISEVDTDSECTSTRNMRKYQRTQTHSRLFRLLNDDSVPEDSSARKQQLSLPLKSNGFSYDESYCSNYSSGLTSPEYSPSCEQSWRRLHDLETGQRTVDQNEEPRAGSALTRQDRVAGKEDPYYQAWKTSKSPVAGDHDVVPSLAFKVLESRRPPWAYKVNVLCPRIKSTKSVPRALQTRKTECSPTNPVSSNPMSYVNLRTERC
nr:flocculation protein FLO11-like [Megalopta genalis]